MWVRWQKRYKEAAAWKWSRSCKTKLIAMHILYTTQHSRKGYCNSFILQALDLHPQAVTARCNAAGSLLPECNKLSQHEITFLNTTLDLSLDWNIILKWGGLVIAPVCRTKKNGRQICLQTVSYLRCRWVGRIDIGWQWTYAQSQLLLGSGLREGFSLVPSHNQAKTPKATSTLPFLLIWNW